MNARQRKRKHKRRRWHQRHTRSVYGAGMLPPRAVKTYSKSRLFKTMTAGSRIEKGVAVVLGADGKAYPLVDTATCRLQVKL